VEKTKEFNTIASSIRSTREKLGLGRTEFANLLGMNSTGERTVRGWETGEHKPTQGKVDAINNLEQKLIDIRTKAPFKYDDSTPSEFKFIDLFAGIGGIRQPFQELGGECVLTSEWDKFAQKTYAANYGEVPNGDIMDIESKDVPDHDVLLAGFPCQSFSQAGLKQGFDDTRGTMFFEVQRILAEKRPKAFLLENVKQLRGHNKGETLKTILAILRGEHEQEIPADVPMTDEARNALSHKLNYHTEFKVLRAGDFGAPQNRERIFIIGFDKDYYGEKANFNDLFTWPVPPKTKTKLGKILQTPKQLAKLDDRYTISDKLWAGHKKRKAEHLVKGNGFGYSLFNHDSEYVNTISARYYKDGSEVLIDQSEIKRNPRLLTPRECARLQGFPDNFIVDAVSHGQIYKQFGNSVCINVIRAVADSMNYTMIEAEKIKKVTRLKKSNSKSK
jgi:DNA (cytosine-5)-methyltransferase 1